MKPEDVTDEMQQACYDVMPDHPGMKHGIAAAINASPLYSAAPQMLEALEEMLYHGYSDEARAFLQAKDAIAAATGGKK